MTTPSPSYPLVLAEIEFLILISELESSELESSELESFRNAAILGGEPKEIYI